MRQTTAHCRMPASRLPYGDMKTVWSRKKSWNQEQTTTESQFSPKSESKNSPLPSRPRVIDRLHDGLIPMILVMRFASGWTSGGEPGTEGGEQFLYELASHAQTRHLF